MQALRSRRVALLRLLLASAPFVVAPGRVAAQDTRQVTRQGFAPERLARIDRFLQQAVDSNRIAGAVGLVIRDGVVVYERAVGWSDREQNRRMTTDAIFRVASQTKAITSTAVLMLVEEGRIALDDPVSRFIPAYAATSVADRADSGRTVAPARRLITIRDLLTHTAGISYGTDRYIAPQYAAKGLGPVAGFGWYTADKDEPVCATMERLATIPFVAQPGTAWVYGYNTDILGCVVERASGIPLDQFITTRITGPLGMRDTEFFLSASKRARLVTVYASDSTNHVARAVEGSRGQGAYVEGPRRNFSGGAGLLSTARDYARFLQMILNHGQLDGVRLLSPKMVDLMITNQSGALYSRDGMGFGLAFENVQRPGANGLATIGSFGWAGAYGTRYDVDPAEHLIMLFMMNLVPNRSGVAAAFPTLVYQALIDARAGCPRDCAGSPPR